MPQRTRRSGKTRRTAAERAGADAGPDVGVEQAEAALNEHYPRLVRLAYLVLPTRLGRHRRVLTAHGLVQRALPRGRTSPGSAPLPSPRDGDAEDGAADGRMADGRMADGSAVDSAAGDTAAGASATSASAAHHSTDGSGAARGADAAYACVRLRVLRAALTAERPRRLGPWELRPLPLLPRPLPQVFGLRLFPRSGGADELALDQALSGVRGAARAAYVLRGLEDMTDRDVHRLLTAAGVPDAERALAEADGIEDTPGRGQRRLLESVEFDPCSLQARPTDLMRRRQHSRAALAAVVAVLACGGLTVLPGGWGPDGPAAPAYARNPAVEKALDPAALTRAAPAAWRQAPRTDFAAWPARGPLARDRELLRRALAVWARPGPEVTVSATRGTAEGPPAGPPQLLYAGRLDGANVVLLYDGLRVARYAEPADGDGVPTEEGRSALDLARTDGAEDSAANALVVSRGHTHVRYLTAPWVRTAAQADLVKASDKGSAVRRNGDGVTQPLNSARSDGAQCDSRLGLLLSGRNEPGEGGAGTSLYTDLGELTPVRLTVGQPDGALRDATSGSARAGLARTACSLNASVGQGVKSVNTWEFARQRLPQRGGRAAWVCTRTETWRATGASAVAQFLPPSGGRAGQAAVSSRASGTAACGPREPHVLSGLLWKSPAGRWYVLAAADRDAKTVRASGGVHRTAKGNTLAAPARKGAQADLSARLRGGGTLHALR